MNTSVSFKKDLVSPEGLTFDTTAVPNRQSVTYFTGDKGDEIADYSYNYKTADGTTIKSTSVNFYTTANLRASDASVTADDAMNTSVSFKKDLVSPEGLTFDTTAVPNRQSVTYFTGDKGDEIADYSYNYKTADGTTIKSTSVNFYTTANLRASDASVTADDAMNTSVSFKKDLVSPEGLTFDTTAVPNRQSVTYFTGDKGDEIADYSYNYKTADGTTIKSTSVNFYTASNLRASDASVTADDAMNASVSFKKNLVSPTGLDFAGTAVANRQSVTYFVGDKGDEISDYSYNYKTADGTTIKSTSVNFYTTSNL